MIEDISLVGGPLDGTLVKIQDTLNSYVVRTGSPPERGFSKRVRVETQLHTYQRDREVPLHFNYVSSCTEQKN